MTNIIKCNINWKLYSIKWNCNKYYYTILIEDMLGIIKSVED